LTKTSTLQDKPRETGKETEFNAYHLFNNQKATFRATVKTIFLRNNKGVKLCHLRFPIFDLLFTIVIDSVQERPDHIYWSGAQIQPRSAMAQVKEIAVFIRKTSVLICIVLSMQSVTFASETAEIKSVLERRLGQEQGSVAVGIITRDGKNTLFHGNANGDTIFELCSVTKVFTALLLADMVVGDELQLDDPVNKFLDGRAKIREDVQLFHLVTHTSGLPRSPADFTMEYSKEQLYDFLSDYSFPKQTGKKFKYSNLGFGLLGQTLALKTGTSYEQLVLDRICRPLQMKDTRIRMSPEQSARHADGYDSTGKKIPTRELPMVYWSAGSLRSTLNDMLKFLKVNLAPDRSRLGRAINKTHEPHLRSIPNTRTGMAWNITSTGISTVIWHEGQIQSHYAFIGLDQKQGIGTVILSSSGIPLTDIGIHILDSRQPITDSEPLRQTKLEFDKSSFDSFIGRYIVRDNYTITISKEEGHLFSQATGMPKLEILPIAEKEFAVKGFNIKIKFISDETGEITSMIVHQAGTEVKARKQP
jgi:CubicO group peptidase (beta-lactamase class C family)